MVVIQLFAEQPTSELSDAVAGAFGLESISDSSPFTRADIVSRGTPAALELLRPALASTYLACKSFYCMDAITPDRCLTILRHFLRAAGLTLAATDQNFDGRRTQTYRIHRPGGGVVRMSRGASVI